MILFNPQHAFYYFYRINLSSHVHQSFSHHVTFIPHCTTLPLSLSLSLTRSWRSPVSTFNLNLYRKSIVIFAIISSLTRCPGVLIVLPVLSPLSLPLPLLSNLWSFGRHSSLALTLFFIINDFFWFNSFLFLFARYRIALVIWILETILIPSVMLELQKPGQSATTSEAPGIAARYDSANTITTRPLHESNF